MDMRERNERAAPAQALKHLGLHRVPYWKLSLLLKNAKQKGAGHLEIHTNGNRVQK